MTDRVISMDLVRRLAMVSARISSGSDLMTTLQAVAEGVVDVIGFGSAVINYRRPDGDFAVVAIAGSPELKAALLGAVSPGEQMRRGLAMSDEWGSLRFTPHGRHEASSAQWVPQIPIVDVEDAWHPLDMLLAPMWADDGELIAVLSVDEPPANRRPSPQICELLEIFVSQASIAITAVEIRELYLAERTARENLLGDLAYRDALTGLANRRALDVRLNDSIARAARTGTPGAVLFCDVNRLKQLNDRRGHVQGDAVLVACATAISRHVRSGDLVSRAGGDEFVVVADAMTERVARQLATRLRGVLVSVGGGEPLDVSLSVGVASINGTSGGQVVLGQADAAMYQDKLESHRRIHNGQAERLPAPDGSDFIETSTWR